MCREHRHIIFTLTSLLLFNPRLDEKGEWLEHNYVGKANGRATQQRVRILVLILTRFGTHRRQEYHV